MKRKIIVYRKAVGGYSIERMFLPIHEYFDIVLYLPFSERGVISIILNSLYVLFKSKSSDEIFITGSSYYLGVISNCRKLMAVVHDLGSLKRRSKLKDWVIKCLYIEFGLKRIEVLVSVSFFTATEMKRLINRDSRVIENYPVISAKACDNIRVNNRLIDFILIGTKTNKNTFVTLRLLEKIYVGKKIIVVGNNVENKNYVSNRVIFKSDVSDEELGLLYSQSKFLLFLSFYEGFGLPIIEAQSFGCIPVVLKKEPMLSVAGSGKIVLNHLEAGELKEILDLRLDEILNLSKKSVENAKKYSLDRFKREYKELLYG